ncbi:hypothetical protein SO694_00046040 [Aureococcus anophagefferens]|uniref:Uncharacterized protein n=1 Tax=Aureococcus anophagefferens TaxID=44056 RepID=A0ABR1G7W7_AURAN
MEKSARRRSSTGSRKVPRRSVLSESTNRHNNAADDAEADSDGDLCHKTDPERGRRGSRGGASSSTCSAPSTTRRADAFSGAARELLRRGVEIVDAADAEDAAGRDALVLRFVDGPEGRVSLRRRGAGAHDPGLLRVGGRRRAVVALSGTLSKFEVGSLLEALGLPPAPATLVIRTASPINSMVDIHTGDGGDEDPDGYAARPARAPWTTWP